ncbi:MAG TPA: NAD(P)/FAD-dependent oxidoreductase [Microbacterium sp.]|nr:NAD(P)/FAD-dependent oxidoreductase [Microbacterium sp.]
METQDCDLIVIGAGPVGENVADRAVAGGMRTVIVEEELVGGSCSYWACVPSKALLRPHAALSAARAVAGARGAAAGDLDVQAVLRRRDASVGDWDDTGQAEWLESAGIDLVRGHGELTEPRRVRVAHADGTVTLLAATHAVAVCTGSAPRVPQELAGIRPWTSRDATSAHEVPASLAIVGGGVVACEMATAYAGLGVRVTMIVRGGILGRVEPFAAEAVRDGLEALGVTMHMPATVTEAHRTAKSAVLTLDDGSRVITEQVLAATGRVPATSELGLENVGLVPGDWLTVDDTLRVEGADWLYAVGDVNHRALLTHQGKYQARAAGDVIAARAKGDAVDDWPWGAHVATADHTAVPQVVFTEPEVASVGATAEQAQRDGRSVRVLDVDLARLAGAAARSDDYRGRARAVVDDDRGVLLGATFTGSGVAEMLQAATIAVVGEVPLHRLWHAVPVFPTLAEVWLRWLEEYGRDSALTSGLSGRSAARP